MSSPRNANSTKPRLPGRISLTLPPSLPTKLSQKPSSHIDFQKFQVHLDDSAADSTSSEFQSMVVVEDFNVEEELNKAQKQGSNIFKVLSMSFYERNNAQLIPPNRQNNLPQVTHTDKLPLQEICSQFQSSPKMYLKEFLKVNPKIKTESGSSTQSHEVSNQRLRSVEDTHLLFQSIKAQSSQKEQLRINTESTQPASSGKVSQEYRVEKEEPASEKASQVKNPPKKALKTKDECIRSTSPKAYYLSILEGSNHPVSVKSPKSKNLDHIDKLPKAKKEKSKDTLRIDIPSSLTKIPKFDDVKVFREVQSTKNAKISSDDKSEDRSRLQSRLTNLIERQLSKASEHSLNALFSPKIRLIQSPNSKGKDLIDKSKVKTRTITEPDSLGRETRNLIFERSHDKTLSVKSPERKPATVWKLENGRMREFNKQKDPEGTSHTKQTIRISDLETLGKLRSLDRATEIYKETVAPKKLKYKRKEKVEEAQSTIELEKSREISQDREHTKGNMNKLGAFSEPKRFSLDATGVPKNSSGFTKVKLKVHINEGAKERCETEPDGVISRHTKEKLKKIECSEKVWNHKARNVFGERSGGY